MADESNNIEGVIEPRQDHTFVLTFGATGSGKSAILAKLFDTFVEEHFAVTYNVKDAYSSELFKEYARKLRIKKELPEATSVLDAWTTIPLQFGDVILEKRGVINRANLTFLEFSGEDLEGISPDFKEAIKDIQQAKEQEQSDQKQEQPTKKKRFSKGGIGKDIGQAETGEEKTSADKPKEPSKAPKGFNTSVAFGNILDELLREDIPVIVLLVASYDYPEVEDELLNMFISLIRHQEAIPNLLGIANIVSMWDKNNENWDIVSFMKKKLPQTYGQLSQLPKSIGAMAFPYSVGTVKDEIKIEKKPEYNYASDVLDWILTIGGYKIPEDSKRNKSSFWNTLKKYW